MRNQAAKDALDASSGDQQEDEVQDRDKSEELSWLHRSPVMSRGKRKQERANKSRPNEMTEEEMIDLALRLSEQEASIVAIRRQKEEEEAMMKAIQDSMSQQDEPCPPESQSLLDETDAPSMSCTRRKLAYSNGRSTSAASQGASEKNQKRGTKQSTDGSATSRKRKRKEGSPLLEMPDLSQTQKIYSQTSPSSSHVVELHLDSLDSVQSSDSTQIGQHSHRKSPVFPASFRKAEVHVPRLCQDLVQSCLSSGFVWSSQDSSPLRSLPARRRSPTFPKSPERSSEHLSGRSPVFSESSREDGGESTPENCRSPVFARNSQSGSCPSPCRSQVHNCNPGFTFSSQESLTSVARTASCRAQSPVFPRSPVEIPATRESPGSCDSCEGEAEHLRSRSPVFDGTGGLAQTHLEVQKHSIKEDVRAVLGHPVRLNQPSVSGHTGEKLEDQSRKAEQQLSSNMTLLWSDEEEDITQVDSPSPVFPEERPVHQAEEQPASLNQLPGGSPGPPASTRRGEPISRRETVSRPPEYAGSSTVHYYWGVPFCPRGLHPDSYTQVILAQMEVYEKSLKQAQRRLLRKAEWGEAIVPQPEKSPQSVADSAQEDFSPRHVVRPRSKKLCDAGDTPAAAEEEEGGGEEAEAEDEQTEERGQEGGGQMDTDDCHLCPETQLSNLEDDRTQDVMVVAELPSQSPELLDVDTILRDDSPAADEQLEEVDIDALLESNSEGGVSDRGRRDEEAEPDVGTDPGETADGGQRRCSSPELDLPVRETSVDCPICQRSFPITEIEVHAAYCDGEESAAADRRPKPSCHEASLKPQRKRARKAGEEGATESCSTVREKCYVCQAVVPLRDYSRHTELCIQQQEAKKENLLSALDKTESGGSDARPSGSKLQPGYIIDLLDDDDDVKEEDDQGGVRISDSPIRSFTPISEATDCLIDFRKQQRSRKLSRRRR